MINSPALQRGGFFCIKNACCKGRRLIHKKKYLSERGKQILVGSTVILVIYEKSYNFNTQYCETTLLVIGRWYSKAGYSHTYYTVKYGDSWLAIAQRNGLSVYALAAQNCKSIYPGTTLQLN
ncbi:LysM peptidoglycan-binding domain-containing protein [Lactiplantibacillus plantarum]|nr:LysM peptidoglycan-binding domain-containing protein [Lactiplantibacillus plantarum]UVE93282.1 LysM peptidoglycan-binding domain-containing protein [Lactiplantibacillus plantarum]